MRSWHPILPDALDRQALLAEHGEVHQMLIALAGRSKAWAKHPETLRWANHRRALIKRHNALAHELRRRGFHHGTPVHPLYLPPAAYRDARGPVPLRSGTTFAQLKQLLRAKIAERKTAMADGARQLAALRKDRADGRFE